MPRFATPVARAAHAEHQRADLTRTGRDFARLRVVLGLTNTQVAAHLAVHRDTLRRWELDVRPADATRAARWRQVLCDLAAERTREIARDGFGLTDLLGADLGAVLGGLVQPRDDLTDLADLGEVLTSLSSSSGIEEHSATTSHDTTI